MRICVPSSNRAGKTTTQDLQGNQQKEKRYNEKLF